MEIDELIRELLVWKEKMDTGGETDVFMNDGIECWRVKDISKMPDGIQLHWY